MPRLLADEQRDDAADATLVAEITNAFDRWRKTRDEALASRKPLRETVWFYWELPRLPRPLIRSKYPTTVPWSAAARAVYAADPSKPVGLVIEHSRPMTVLLDELLDAAPLDTEAALRILQQPAGHVVMTVEEHKRLDAAGVGRGSWDRNDPLGRYATAGMDSGSFRPLADDLTA